MKSICERSKRNLTPSPPSRGAWIEICTIAAEVVTPMVAPLAGGVD